jgi:ATP-dependent Clp protease ATP-binding subunit ClpC
MSIDNILKRWCIRATISKIIVEPTSVEETITILNNIKNKYEDHHNVIYSQDAIEACVKLTDRYMSERFLPDKAIDALDEAGSRVHITNIEVPKSSRFRTSIGRNSRTKNVVVKKQKIRRGCKT